MVKSVYSPGLMGTEGRPFDIMKPNKKTLFMGVAVVLTLVLLIIFRELVVGWFQHRWQDAIDWNINPYIFVGLLFATLYHYYKGWWQIGKGLVMRDKELLLKGVALNRFVWAIPYLYVLIFGRGYPWWVPAGIVAWMAFGIVMFARNYRKREYVERMNNSLVGKFVGKLTNRKSEPQVSHKEETK